jgi:hypothetical protein
MAIVSTKNPSELKLKFDCGKGENGKSILKTKTYSNVRANATVEDVYEAVASLATIIANVGFPITLSMYLLIRIEGKL